MVGPSGDFRVVHVSYSHDSQLLFNVGYGERYRNQRELRESVMYA